MLKRLVTSREAILLAAIVVLLGLIATRFPGLRRAREPGQRVQRHLAADPAGARPDGGDPDQVHRSVGGGEPRAHRHGRVDAERRRARRAGAGDPGGRRRARHDHGHVQRSAGVEGEHPADRRDARHDDDLSRHHLPDLGRQMGERARDVAGLQGVSARRVSRPAGAELDRHPRGDRGSSC